MHGADFYLHMKGEEVVEYNGIIMPEIAMDTMPSMSPQAALDDAESASGFEVVRTLEPELVIYPMAKDDFKLAYRVVTIGEGEAKVSFVDARTGKIIFAYDDIHNGTTTLSSTYEGNVTVHTTTQDGTVYLYDSESGPEYIRVMTAGNGTSLPGSYVTTSAASSTVSKGAQMLYALELTVEFYENEFNYNSYDNDGASLTSTIEYDRNYANAYWSPYDTQFVFGDGDGSTMGFLGGIDVVAHEFSHAFCSSTANLQYSYESGAINEANSDIMGSQVDPDKDWLIGEDVMISASCLRDIENPQNSYGYALPRYYSERYTGSDDNGGVHINMSLGTKFFQLLCDGGDWYNGSETIHVNGIGNEKALQIWFNCMTSRFTTTTNFSQARTYTIAAAESLYGTAEADEVKNAWAAVGIGDPASGGGGTTTEDTYEPNDSTSQAYEVEAGYYYDSYISSSSDVEYYKLVLSQDGDLSLSLGNLPADYDMYLYNTSGTELAKAYTTNNPETISKTVSAGTYYIKVNGYNGASSTTSAYRLSITFEADSSGGGGSTSDDPYEPNDSTAEAYEIASGTVYNSYLYTAGDVDYYKFTADDSGSLYLELGDLPKDYDMYLYNASGTQLAKAYTTSNPEKITADIDAGTYYIKVNGYNNAYSAASMYYLKAVFTPDGGGSGGSGEPQWYVETLSTAVETPHNYPNNWNNDYVYSKSGAQKVAVHFSTFQFESNYDYVYIYDSNGTRQASYTGTQDAFWAIVDGGSITVRTDTDYSYTYYGYKIDQVAYYSDAPLSLAPVSPVDIQGKFSVDFIPGAPIKARSVENYPNPFNPETDIYFNVPAAGNVSVRIFDTRGRLVKELANCYMDAGQHQLHWNGRDNRGRECASGVYYCVTSGNGFRATRKMIMLK